MKKHQIITIASCIIILCSCNQKPDDAMKQTTATAKTKKEDCCKKPTGELSCKLTTPELQKRKATVLESLRKQILEKKELPNGYAFKFNGSDKMIDELTEFAKTERECCDFFTFNLSITGDKNSLWFEITGPREAKEFIKTEMEL